MASLFEKTGTFKPDSLIVDNVYPFLTKGITLAAGQGILKRGTLIGDVSGEGHLTGKVISSEDPDTEDVTVGVVGILTDDTDTADAAIATLYITGVFNEEALIMADGVEIQAYKEEMIKCGMFTKKVQWYEKEE